MVILPTNRQTEIVTNKLAGFFICIAALAFWAFGIAGFVIVLQYSTDTDMTRYYISAIGPFCFVVGIILACFSFEQCCCDQR